MSRSPLSEYDVYLFNEGSHFRIYEKLGAQVMAGGTHFAVWAPNAASVSVMGQFNQWDPHAHALLRRKDSGIWERFVPEARAGMLYKYCVVTADGQRLDKADPVGFWHETPPKTASVIMGLDYAWGDAAWMAERAHRHDPRAPISIYEVHAGSWRRVSSEGNRSLGYRELAVELADHCVAHGFTHVELLPVMEHPFAGSWGYQVTGYFAPTSRFGTPQDFMALVDYLHQRGIGVILDWVPAHFPTDGHALGWFDGTHLYEHADPRQGFHPDWTTFIFNYGRYEVRNFLISSAAFWLDRYHVDGLRVDGVASMLYLDYSRKEGEWIPNEHGGRENTAAISFLQRLNEHLVERFPGAQTFAEESTAWPGVSKPTSEGGLGFGYKWDMGWMHDTLAYFARDPLHRVHHHNELTFRGMYAFTERFVLPLSHDEVVHGKGSLYGKMFGTAAQRLAQLRLLYAHMFGAPGKKLLFMGSELAQTREWSCDEALDWQLLKKPSHRGIARLVRDLNTLYRGSAALHELDHDPAGFEWLAVDDHERSVIAYLRRASDGSLMLVALNFTPLMRERYRLLVPVAGKWEEVLNTDAQIYGGKGVGNLGSVTARKSKKVEGRWSLTLTLPPLGAVFLRPAAKRRA